jgi:hypothetical protein
MCKRHTFVPEPQLASDGVYEGQTMRLDPRQQALGIRQANGHCWGFPWWALWLIWPLIGLTKLTAPLVLGTLAAFTGSLGIFGAQFVAVILIIAGIALLRRS